MAIERMQIRLPAGFDPGRHPKALPGVVAQAHGDGWEVESVSLERGIATLTRQSAVVEVVDAEAVASESPQAFEIKLPASVRAADGDKFAARQADAHPGYHLIRFEPHVGRAVMGKMTEREFHCREAVANVLGVKPWEVTCRQSRDGGFTLQLPIEGKGRYTPAKHDTKMQEVAEVIVGQFGWYFTVDTKTMVCRIIPSAPPTFPAVVPFPFKSVKPVTDFGPNGDAARFTLDLAEGLGGGGEPNRPVQAVMDDAVAILIVGLPGSGKSIAVQSMVYQALIKGYRLAIIDTPAKRGDFAWAKPYVQDHWWGCSDEGTSVAEALTVATLLDEEGKRIGALMDSHGVTKWQDLPPAVKKANPPVLVVADELANLLSKPNVPAGLPKEAKGLPEFVRMAQDYMESKLLTAKLNAIVAVHRAAGVRALYLSQRPSKTEGFPPELKSLIPHRWLLGPTPSDADIAMAFRDPKRISRVPANISADPTAARGVGVAHLDGMEPMVVKGFYAPVDQFEKHLRVHLGAGDPSDSRVRPTAEQIARCVPQIGGDDDLDDEGEPLTVGGDRLPSGKPLSSLPPEFGPEAAYGDDGKCLKGAAAAARASKQLADKAKAEPGPPCPSCDQPIQPDGSCACSW